MKHDRAVNVTVAVTSAVLALALLPGLWREAGRAPAGGSAETLVAGKVVRPQGTEPAAALTHIREAAAAAGERFEAAGPGEALIQLAYREAGSPYPLRTETLRLSVSP